MAKPAVDTLLDALVEAVAPVPPGDADAVRTALTGILAASAPVAPSATRVVDRDLVQGPSGQRATDQEIEAGTFTVVAQVQGDPWWIVLDTEGSDIAVTIQQGT